jgi:hypothetical protein
LLSRVSYDPEPHLAIRVNFRDQAKIGLVADISGELAGTRCGRRAEYGDPVVRPYDGQATSILLLKTLEARMVELLRAMWQPGDHAPADAFVEVGFITNMDIDPSFSL